MRDHPETGGNVDSNQNERRHQDATGQLRLGASGSLQIDRRQWGISYSKVLDNGGLIAGNEVQIELDVEAKKK